MDLKEKFLDFIKRHNISQNQAASACGYSGSVISAWLNDSYNGNIAAVEQAVTVWIEREGNRRTIRAIPIVETDALRRITNGIKIVHVERDIGVIAGPAGIGKTTALLRYCDQNPGSAIYVEADASMNKVALMQSIAMALMVDAGGEFTGLVKRIIKALKEKDVVVFIDQADYLNDGSLELLRQVVHDKGQSGLVLAGLQRLEFRLKNVKNDHQQLLSRIGVFIRLEGTKETDVEKVVTSVWPELDKETVNAYAKAAGNSVRVLTKLIERSHRITATNNQELPSLDTVALAGSLILK